MNRAFQTWPRVFGQAGLLVLAAGALALAGNALRPDGVSWQRNTFQEISLAGMAQAQSSGRGFFIDARPAQDYALGHVAGAFNFPVEEKEAHPNWIHTQLPADQSLVLYCRDAQCPGSRDLAEFLAQNGIQPERIFIFTPGWEALRSQTQLPLSMGAQP